ncbi:MAG TPA: DUF1415 domain-containing protein [Planctomycetota bacterium]|nr:DUF1415 domain-containing protein [Planctomycetota bacterium]
MTTIPGDEEIIAATKAWLEKDVIGLNLCPFAKEVHTAGKIRYVVSAAATAPALLSDLAAELIALHEADRAQTETTLLIHPHVMTDFFDFNDFLGDADAALERLGLAGIIQVASFHPQYQFADTTPDDPANRTNRSPYPTLHLLCEASVERALESYPDADDIPARNIETMRRLAGQPPPPASSPPGDAP